MSKVFVGNLDFGTTREELEELFAPSGAITDVTLPVDRDSGRARGFAFVTFESAEGAAKAIRALDGTELRGRPLRVNEASPERTGRPRGGGGYASSGFGAAPGRRPARAKGSRRNIRGRKRSLA